MLYLRHDFPASNLNQEAAAPDEIGDWWFNTLLDITATSREDGTHISHAASSETPRSCAA